MSVREILLHVIHFDSFWMKELNWCDFTWDGRYIPTPEKMLTRLKERGLHVCLWVNPYIPQRSKLVAPVMNNEGIATFYVPKGSCTNLLDGRTILGPRWVQEKHDFLILPILVRQNLVIPKGSRADRPDYDYSDNITLRIYQLENGISVRVELPSLAGGNETIFIINKVEDIITIQREGPPKTWKGLLVNNHSNKLGRNGELVPVGTLFTPNKE
jgi:alpha-D-xyloside xylohydrolase